MSLYHVCVAQRVFWSVGQKIPMLPMTCHATALLSSSWIYMCTYKCVTWLRLAFDLSRYRPPLTCLSLMCDMTHSYVWHDYYWSMTCHATALFSSTWIYTCIHIYVYIHTVMSHMWMSLVTRMNESCHRHFFATALEEKKGKVFFWANNVPSGGYLRFSFCVCVNSYSLYTHRKENADTLQRAS